MKLSWPNPFYTARLPARALQARMLRVAQTSTKPAWMCRA